mgnify:CR=1 FL=1
MKLYSSLLIFTLLFGGQDKPNIQSETQQQKPLSVVQNLIPYENKSSGLWGFRNQKTGRVDIECRFDEVSEFTEKITSVRIGQLWGFIDQKGKMVIQPKFDRVEDLVDGRFWVKNSHGSFLIDRKEKIFVSLIYDEVGSFSEGLCWVKKDEKYGFINKQGVSPYPSPEF